MLLRCESLEPPMSQMGQSRRSDGQQGFADVRYAFNSDRIVRRNEPTPCAIFGTSASFIPSPNP